MIKKIPIEDYPKDTAPVVLLWNDEWLHPVVGSWSDHDLQFYDLNSRIGETNIFREIPYDRPSHFSYLQEEG